MQIGGPSITTDFHIPSKTGDFKLNDLVVQRNDVFQKTKKRGAVGSQYPYIELANPAASGIIILVDRIDVKTANTADLQLCWYNSSLPTDDGAGVARSPAGGVAIGHIHSHTDVVSFGTSWWAARSLANSPNVFNWMFPLYLLPEESIMVRVVIINTDLTVSYEWREIAI